MTRKEFYEHILSIGHITKNEIGCYDRIIDDSLRSNIFSESKILDAILDTLPICSDRLKRFGLEVPYSKRWIIQKCKPQPKSKHNNRKQKKKRK